MLDLSSFPSPIHVAIIGASGGIGSAMTAALAQHDAVERIYALSRNPSDDQPAKVTPLVIDICDEEQIKEAAEQIDTPLHLLINASGILHDSDFMPEKTMQSLDAELMTRVFMINTIGPALVAKYFLPLLPREGKSVFASLSARVGSISDNRLGGWHSYRASKAALNMVIKNIAIETARKNKDMAVIGLHPGTVDTKLSQPFQSNVKEGKLFSPEQSAEYLLNVINQVDAQSSGKIFAWDGQEIQP